MPPGIRHGNWGILGIFLRRNDPGPRTDSHGTVEIAPAGFQRKSRDTPRSFLLAGLQPSVNGADLAPRNPSKGSRRDSPSRAKRARTADAIRAGRSWACGTARLPHLLQTARDLSSEFRLIRIQLRIAALHLLSLDLKSAKDLFESVPCRPSIIRKLDHGLIEIRFHRKVHL